MNSAKYSDLEASVQRRLPLAALVLGSGFNQIADNWPCHDSVRFEDIPGMPATTVAGHRGRVGLFEFADDHVLVFQGRLHFYEGHPWDLVERPARIAAELGARTLILTNASGGIGAKQTPGTLMAIRDHIAAMRPNWWLSPGRGGIGPELPSPYSARILELMRDAASAVHQALPEGNYAAVTGPSYETPAEIRALQKIGADAVGMSTVHEANIARSLGMEVAAISCVANRAAGLSQTPLTHADVLAVVNSAAERMAQLLHAILVRLKADRST